MLFIISDADVVAGRREWIPGDVEPAGAGKELVGVLPFLEEIHERRKLGRIFRVDVCCLTDEMLGAGDTTNLAINCLASKSGVDDDRACDESRGLQQLMASIGKIHNNLHCRYVLRVFAEIKKLAQLEVSRESYVI